ncbi:MAG: serine/threonine-protein kinase [Bryobacteraceae bacterium]|jgi:serine/threonine-protein kinase
MARCISCASEVAESSRFCPACGVAVDGGAFADETVAMSTPASHQRRTPGRHSSSGTSQGRFAPGYLLGGRYRIVAMLGKGGMGEVYRADDLSLEQPVALKFLPEAVAGNPDALARFRNEVRIARQVSHPNVCRMYDLGEADGCYFLSMEYVDGEDLGSLLRRIGRLPSDKALEIARKLCAGLAAAHEKGVLHRDLKPANVMLDGRGQVLLTDFGLAGLAGQIEGAEVRNGTPAYMAPEQLSGQEVTARSDIYSLGLVLYEIFTGKLPFESNTLAGLMRAQQESQPASPSTLVRDLDPTVERVILRCLQPKPALRPGSALAVAAALPGGDPLAEALAAGETPSPEMVAAAGEGEGLSPAVAVSLLVAVLAAIAISSVLNLRASALERLRPEYSPEILAQKAKDTIQRLGFTSAVADDAYGFDWDNGFLDDVDKNNKSVDWDQVLAQKPPLLMFWYRSSPAHLTGVEFHDDLLTPGMVQRDDPPPVDPGMIEVLLDSYGRLSYFKRVPAQRLKPGPAAAAVDWSAFFAAAGVDMAQFQPTEPLWTAVTASDARVAWLGNGNRPLRVEGASLRGHAVYFALIRPWKQPGGQDAGQTSTRELITFSVLGILLLVVCLGAALLARRNLAQQRGDRRGAFRLAALVFSVQMLLWLARGHLALSFGTFGTFLLALCTSVFYGAVIWTVYIALEPYVRRRWPQTLISWSSVLIGRLRDPVVGRDVLIGATVGSGVLLIGSLVDFWRRHLAGWTPSLDNSDVLAGARGMLATCLAVGAHAIRETLFFFFLIFLLRVLLRNQWVAAAAFGLIFAALNLTSASHPFLSAATAFLVVGAFAFVVLRWGILALAITLLVANLMGSAPITSQTSAWYFSSAICMLAVPVALTVWAFRTAIGGRRLWKSDLLG